MERGESPLVTWMPSDLHEQRLYHNIFALQGQFLGRIAKSTLSMSPAWLEHHTSSTMALCGLILVRHRLADEALLG